MTLEDLYKGELLKRKSLSGKPYEGGSTPFLDNKFRRYMGEITIVYKHFQSLFSNKNIFSFRPFFHI